MGQSTIQTLVYGNEKLIQRNKINGISDSDGVTPDKKLEFTTTGYTTSGKTPFGQHYN